MFNQHALKILEKRYLLKDSEGKITETPNEMFERVLNYVCESDKDLKTKTRELFYNKLFLPNTPTLMNAGTTNLLSACFRIPVDDNLESIIHDAGWWQAYIHKLGGGVGINFSNLRPKGDYIKTTGGTTSGIVGFMRVFDVISSVIKQGGKRDGANMGILRVDHPEIEDFILIKTKSKDYENFNLSVLVNKDFMDALRTDSEIKLHFNGKIYKTIEAKYLWDLICQSSWKCGCPGILFEDNMNIGNPFENHGMHIDGCNPCGEQMLFCGQYNGEVVAESCNLGSINLSRMVINNEIDWNKIKSTVFTATEFLDRVIDRNEYPFEFIDKGTKLTRKIGLGVTGFHEMLVKLNVPYGSDKSIGMASDIMKNISEYSHEASEILACAHGTYPIAHMIGDKKRNATTTTIAPTGSIGRIMMGHGYSLGIEPPYAISMHSKIIESSMDEGIYPLLLQLLNEKAEKDTDFKDKITSIIEKIQSNGSSIQGIEEIPETIRKLFKTAHEVTVEQHIAIQSAFQKYTDNAVSKTINLSSDATPENISKAFLLAYNSGCKGVTIFRNNSKDSQVMNVSNNILNEQQKSIDELSPRPSILPSLSFTKKTACNTLFINPTFMDDNKGALETFIDSAGEGGCSAMKAGLGITISVYQRIIKELLPEYANDALDIVMSHLLQVKCPACTQAIIRQKYEKTKRNVDSLSCPNAVAQVMKYMLQHQIAVTIDGKPYSQSDFSGYITNQSKCKQCGTVLIKTEGCSSLQCPVCGIGGCS